jgi:HEPN domain-containing protein
MSGKVIHEWISKAEQDRTASKTLIKNKRQTTYDVICFHCQQCIEKYLKSYLIYRNTPFPKSHDLMGILDIIVQKDGTFELIRDLIKPLSKFAIRFRYPGEEAKRPEAKQAIEIMEKARSFILERLDQ